MPFTYIVTVLLNLVIGLFADSYMGAYQRYAMILPGLRLGALVGWGGGGFAGIGGAWVLVC